MNIVHAPEDLGSWMNDDTPVDLWISASLRRAKNWSIGQLVVIRLFYRGPIIQYCCNFNYEPTAHTHRYWITVHRIWYCEYHPGNFGSLWDVQPRASGGKVTGKFSNTSGLSNTNRMLISASRHVDQGWIKNDHPLKGIPRVVPHLV